MPDGQNGEDLTCVQTIFIDRQGMEEDIGL